MAPKETLRLPILFLCTSFVLLLVPYTSSQPLSMDLIKADGLIDDNKNLPDAIWVPSSSNVNLDESNTENPNYEQLFRVLSKLMVAYHEHDQDNELDGAAPVRRANFWKRSNFWRKRANFWRRELA